MTYKLPIRTPRSWARVSNLYSRHEVTAAVHLYLEVKRNLVASYGVRSAEAIVIDVRRIASGDADDRRVAQPNLTRLTRWLRLWRDQLGLTSRIRTCTGCLTRRSIIHRDLSAAEPTEAACP